MGISDIEGKIFARLLDSCGDGVFLADHEGRYLAANAAGLQFVGYTIEELLQLKMSDLTAPEERAKLKVRVEKLRRERVRMAESELLHRDGTLLPVEIGATALPDGRMLGIVRDTSLRRKIERRADRSRRLLGTLLSVTEHLALASEENHLLELDAICRLLVEGQAYALAWICRADWETGEVDVVGKSGVAVEYLEGITVRCDDSPEGRGPTGKAIRTGRYVLNNKIPLNPRFGPWREAAKRHSLQASASFPIYLEGKVWGALNIYAQQADAFDGVEVMLIDRLVGNLGASMNAHREATRRQILEARLRKLERLSTLGTLSNRIASPLAAVATHLESLSQGQAGFNGEQARTLAQALEVVSTAREMIEQANQVAQGGALQLAPLDLEGVILDTLKLVNTRLEGQVKLQCVFQQVPSVVGDPLLVGQILLNLLDNAINSLIDAAHPEFRGVLRLELSQASSGNIELRVEDNGPGVEAALRDEIFEPLFTTREAQGAAGLGLSICKALASKLQGWVEIRDATNLGGGCFVLSLRRSPEAATPLALEQRRLTPHKEEQRLQLLVVDDEPMIGRSLAALLGRRHSVKVAGCGSQALELCELQGFDVILCDVTMPEMSGVEFLTRLSQRSPDQARRVVFLSGAVLNDRLGAEVAALKNLKLGKPAPLEKLLTLIDTSVAQTGRWPSDLGL